MADHLSSPPSSHGEERRFIAEFDEEEISNIAHVQEMRRSGRNVSTSRAKGLHWFSVFCIIANRMIGRLIKQKSENVSDMLQELVFLEHLTLSCETLKVSLRRCCFGWQA